MLNSMLQDLQVRTLVQQALHKALDQHDLLLSPVAPTTAFKIGEKSEDPLAMYKEDLMTVPLNLAGKTVKKWHCLENLLMFGSSLCCKIEQLICCCRSARYQHTLRTRQRLQNACGVAANCTIIWRSGAVTNSTYL